MTIRLICTAVSKVRPAGRDHSSARGRSSGPSLWSAMQVVPAQPTAVSELQRRQSPQLQQQRAVSAAAAATAIGPAESPASSRHSSGRLKVVWVQTLNKVNATFDCLALPETKFVEEHTCSRGIIPSQFEYFLLCTGRLHIGNRGRLTALRIWTRCREFAR